MLGRQRKYSKAVADAIGLTLLRRVVYEDKLKEIKNYKAEGKISYGR
jgi:hypothetical protein